MDRNPVRDAAHRGHPLPQGASMSTDVSLEFHGVGLALDESSVILSLPSRFEGAGDGGDEYCFFGDERLKKRCAVAAACLRTIETALAFPDAVIVPLHTDGWAHFRQNANDLRASFDNLGFGPRLKRLEPGVTTVIEPPHRP
jgi:hypothetical protein